MLRCSKVKCSEVRCSKIRCSVSRRSNVLLSNIIVTTALCLLFALSAFASAQSISPYLNYQGKLSAQGTGAPVNEVKNITFSLYDSATGGSPIYSQTRQVNISNGTFSVYLGKGYGDYSGSMVADGIPAAVFIERSAQYLGIRIEGSSVEMTPRQSLASVAYAYKAVYAMEAEKARQADKAKDAEKVGGLSPSQLMRNDADNTLKGKLTVTDATGGKAISVDAANQEVKVGDNKVWHQGNMGAGSGLNADMLDGYDSSALTVTRGCYVSYSGDCISGFTNSGSAGSWGYCNVRPRQQAPTIFVRPAVVVRAGGMWVVQVRRMCAASSDVFLVSGIWYLGIWVLGI